MLNYIIFNFITKLCSKIWSSNCKLCCRGAPTRTTLVQLSADVVLVRRSGCAYEVRHTLSEEIRNLGEVHFGSGHVAEAVGECALGDLGRAKVGLQHNRGVVTAS